MSIFKLEDGTPQNLPAEQPLKKYDVEVKDGWVHVML
jgi:nitrite reductase/ring-hydroxylating ferredoxin subunit